MYITHSTVSLYGNSSVNLNVLNPTGQYISGKTDAWRDITNISLKCYKILTFLY